MRPGLLQQNNPLVTGKGGNTDHVFYEDPDGVVRRAMAADYPVGAAFTTAPGTWPFTGNAYTPAPKYQGLPMVSSIAYTSQNPNPATSSRPIVLNRPFHSVAELGYVFRGEPWKDLDFFTPQSGDAGLLDVFCINDDTRPDALVAGKVDINTRQIPVLQAILAGAYEDELNFSSSSNLLPVGSSTSGAQGIATALVKRTTGTAINTGPLRNISELVGKCINSYTDPYTAFYGQPPSSLTVGYDGFANDIAGLYTGSGTEVQSIVSRLRETTIRALSDVGTARVWNLMIDVVAQTGRYPLTSTTLDQFVVDGEQHYWVHVAIDRYTGQVIDINLEPVTD